MAASTGAPTLLFGTAWDGHSLLEQAAAANRERDARGPCGDPAWLPWHHQVGWREVAASRPRYGDYVRGERARLGAGHPLFLSQYELVASASAGKLFTLEQLARLEGGYPRLRAPVAGERYAAGLDFGGEGAGADRSVLTIARVREGRCEVVEHAAWQSAPFEAVLGGALALARLWRLERLCADATGLGAPLAASLGRELGGVVEPVVFTGPLKSGLGFDLIAAAGTGALALYEDDGSAEARTCRTELHECGACPRDGGQLAWGSPRGNDDFVASLALCLRGARALGPARLAVGRRPPG